MCDITIQDELENVLAWSSVNKLQLNLTKTKEIVFRRASVNFDVLPQQLSNVERLECVRLLGIYVDSKLSFSEQVDRLLSVCNACRIDCDVYMSIHVNITMNTTGRLPDNCITTDLKQENNPT